MLIYNLTNIYIKCIRSSNKNDGITSVILLPPHLPFVLLFEEQLVLEFLADLQVYHFAAHPTLLINLFPNEFRLFHLVFYLQTLIYTAHKLSRNFLVVKVLPHGPLLLLIFAVRALTK